MKIDILTLFPEMFAPLKESIIKRAVEDGKIEINIINIRDFAVPPHFKCDDEPFGGGAGMVMMCEPLFKAIESVKKDNSKIYYMSPRGKVFNQELAKELSTFEHIIFICGHYEGIDQRVIDYFNIEELSIGDYVLTGGELPAMVVSDSIIRLIPGVIKEDSTKEESFSENLLEYNQYTRPAEFRGIKVPEILLSGNHKKIEEFRKNESITITKKNRPDLLKGE
ncbi:MAG: tRNA (guanosine(37)-N1)-methyltransferase TrmD [Clostridiales bacterium]|nr:tRNA (guanosine(37)-N1)-methyltransferase TrmD [Clostridiales bacterium]